VSLSGHLRLEAAPVAHLEKVKKDCYGSEFHDWCKYQQKNNLLLEIPEFGRKLYLFVEEKVGGRFINRVHVNKNYDNITFKDMLQDTDQDFISSKFSTDTTLIDNMFNTDSRTKAGRLSYFWIDYLAKAQVRKVTLYFNVPAFVTPAGVRVDGVVIGMGYNAEDLTQKNRIAGFQSSYFIAKMSLLVALVALILFLVVRFRAPYYIEKTIFLVTITTLFCLHYLVKEEASSSVTMEFEKIESIDSGISSISFLSAFSIFVISSMYLDSRDGNTGSLLRETIVLTCFATFCLLIAIYKETSYLEVQDLVDIRKTNQLLFNFSIILNVFILSNYIIFSTGRGR